MKKNSSAAFLYTLILSILLSSWANAGTYYAVASGNWNNNTTWSLTSGGTEVSPGIWPIAGDIIYISEGAAAYSVTIPSGYAASCSALYMGSSAATAATLTLADATASLEVSGSVIVYGPGDNTLREILINEGSLSIGGNLELGNGQTVPQGNRICRVTITTGSLSISGNLVFNNLINSSPDETWISMEGGAGTLYLEGDFIIGNNIGRLDAGTMSTFNFNGSLAPQVIPIGVSNVVYNHITVSNIHLNGATLSTDITPANVTGNLSVQAGTLNNGGFAITLAPAKNFSVSDGATFILTGTSTMVSISDGGTKTFGPNSLVNFAGESQNVSADTYGNLTFDGSGVKTFGAGNSFIEGTLSMEGTATAANIGTLTYRVGATLQYMGNVAQVTGVEFPTTFNGNGGVIVNNPNGVTLNASRTIGTFLYLTNGRLNTLSSTLKMNYSSPSAISGGSSSSYINGNLERSIAAGTNSYFYPIGTETAYTPVNIDFQTGTNAGSLLIFTTDGDHPDIQNSFMNAFRTVNRYWTLTAISGLAIANYNATFNWASVDEDAPFTYATASCGKYDNNNWTYPTMGSLTPASAQITGISGFSDFQIGNLCESYPTATISGDATICLGGEAILTVDLSGTPPWTYTWFDGETIHTVSGITASPSYISVYPTKNTTYSVIDVMDGVGCTDAGTGSATILTGPIAIAPAVSACFGELVEVPITVRDFENVGAISLTLNYNKNVIIFDSYDDNTGNIQYINVDETGAMGIIRISGISLTTFSPLPDDDVLLTLYFTHLGGSCDLLWNDSDDTWCEFATGDPGFIPFCDDPTNIYYITGSVTEATVTGDFAADNLFPPKFTDVQFTSANSPNVNDWLWSFDRPTVTFENSTDQYSQNPVVQFTDGGLYTVTLTVSNEHCEYIQSKVAYIRAGTPGLWDGSTSNDWDHVTNWDDHLLPASLINVVIPTRPVGNVPPDPIYFYPTVSGNLNIGTDCNSITITGTGELSVSGILTVEEGKVLNAQGNSVVTAGTIVVP